MLYRRATGKMANYTYDPGPQLPNYMKKRVEAGAPSGAARAAKETAPRKKTSRLVHLSRRVLLQLCCPLPGLALDSPHLTAQHDMGLRVRTQRLHLFL